MLAMRCLQQEAGNERLKTRDLLSRSALNATNG